MTAPQAVPALLLVPSLTAGCSAEEPNAVQQCKLVLVQLHSMANQPASCLVEALRSCSGIRHSSGFEKDTQNTVIKGSLDAGLQAPCLNSIKHQIAHADSTCWNKAGNRQHRQTSSHPFLVLLLAVFRTDTAKVRPIWRRPQHFPPHQAELPPSK